MILAETKFNLLHLDKTKCWSKQLGLMMCLLKPPLQFKNNAKVGFLCLSLGVALGNLPHQL